ncbi:carboxypeptidase-like regulatory domain-containing protein [Paludisphaera borealis]|uniref:Carboxypeptidase regulatory-like domain-containing protein n=1 Tax=Paludisphaera borealis TaxID=1387353 RepID=A0A1U7CJL3_9BACT|nr:carboxypeptidase-like regulatory domain-containing protein [Paludisphaera borealis]APW59122.1 hypothetical protein BSF38_00536 [Paludisphaera borealis]
MDGPPWPITWAWGWTMAMLISLACVALGMTIPLSGTVEDAAGRPVAGATVWLGDTIATRKGSEVLATAKTDENGRFRLERAADLVGRGRSWSPTLWAYKPGGRIAHLEFKGDLPAADEPVRLVLGPPASTPVRVLNPDGKPAKGASVRPVYLRIKAPRPPDKLLDRLGATTDADGRATLDGFAPVDVELLDVTVEGQIVQYLPLDPDDGTLTLRPLGRLKVRIVADDPKVLKGWIITASSHPTDAGYQGPTTHWARETTGDDGRIDFPPLATGRITWDAKPPEGSNYLLAKQPGGTVRAGETEEVEIAVRRGVRIEGVVKEESGGAPVAGVQVVVTPLQGNSQSGASPVTDARGRISAVIPPGTTRLTYIEVPKDYFLPPRVQNWVDFEVKEGEERHECAPPPLRKAAHVRGRVVDEAGEPSPWAAVSGSWSLDENGFNTTSTIHAETDARGEFVLGSIPPNARVTVTASSGWTTESDSSVVPKVDEGEPTTIRLRKRPTLALSGRVLGPDGRPLADAQIRVMIRAPVQGFNSGSPFMFGESEEVRTGPDGRYKTPAQLPVKHEYRIEAQASRCEPSMSRWLVGQAVEVPDLVLRRSIGVREAAGWVVDSTGKPVVGAEVFQSGDGPRRTRGVTDADGRFRVAKVPDAPAFLFVAREGYRFLGRRVEPEARAIEFVLRRLDEPPAALLGSAGSPVARDEERAIARDLIAQARKAPGGGGDSQRGPLAVAALVDPDRMVEMIENQVVAVDAGVLTALAIGRSEGDPRKVLEILDAIDSPATASHAALGLFDRLGRSARPAFRRELLDRAERRAHDVGEPGQEASLLARAADRRLDIGDVDRGSALAREAQTVAARPGQQLVPDPLDDLASALARVDLAAALKLLDGQAKPPGVLDMTRAAIAKRIAAANPAEARRLLGVIQENNRWSARRAVCARMVAKDLPAARALAAEGGDAMLAAVLPAFAARALADSDPRAARELLFESVEKLGKLDQIQAAQPAPAVVLARLVPLAVRLDPDRAPSCLWLALSRRPPLPDRELSPVLPDVRQRYLDLAELAALTSRYDRAAAEVVFAPVAARLAALDDEPCGLGNEGPAIFRAAGAFDARAARALLDALPEDPPPLDGRQAGFPNFRHHSKAEARVALAEVLGLPPRLRLREPFMPIGGDDWLEVLDDRGMGRIEGP